MTQPFLQLIPDSDDSESAYAILEDNVLLMWRGN